MASPADPTYPTWICARCGGAASGSAPADRLCPGCRAAGPYTPEVLAVYCKTCEAPVGAKCSIFSEILGRVRELREPHGARIAYSRLAAARKARRKPRAD